MKTRIHRFMLPRGRDLRGSVAGSWHAARRPHALILAVLLLLLGWSAGTARAAPNDFSPADTLRALRENEVRCGAQRRGVRLLAEAERRFGTESLEVAELLDELAWAYALPCTVTWWGARQAVRFAERAVAIKERVMGRESVELAESLENLADRLCFGSDRPDLTGYADGDCERGERARGRALEMRKRLQGEGHPEVLERLAARAAAADTARARALYQQAAAAWEDSLGPRCREVAWSLYRLGRFLVNAERDTSGAKRHFDRAVAILEAAPESDVRLLADLYEHLGFLASPLGRAQKPFYEQAVEVIEKVRGPRSPLLIKYLNNLAHGLSYSGDHEEARLLYERVLALERETEARGPRAEALFLWGLAECHSELGENDQYLRWMEGVLETYSKVDPPYDPQSIFVLSDMASVQLGTGDYEAAERTIERAEIAMKRHLEKQPKDSTTVMPFVYRGRLMFLRGRYAEALPFLRVGVTRLDPYEGYWRAAGLAWLAEARHAVGDLDGADSCYAAALTIWDRLECHNLFVMATLNGLGDLKLTKAEYEQASEQFGLAVERIEQTLGPDHPEAARALKGLADARAGLGDYEGALAAALEAENMSAAHARLLAQALSERQALRYAAVRPRGMDLALTLTARGVTGRNRALVWDGLLRSRAQVFDELTARRRAVVVASAEDPEIVELRATLRRSSERLANLLVRSVTAGSGSSSGKKDRERLALAREAKERAERELAERSNAYRRKLERERIGLDEVRAALGPEDALVAYLRYVDGLPGERANPGGKETYLAFVLRGGAREPEALVLGPAQEIENRVKTLRAATWRGALGIAPVEEAYRRMGRAVREKVWDALVGSLEGVERVFIVPDGVLNLINLAALPSEAGGYLVENGPVFHYLTAERDLVPEAAVASVGEGLLALGNVAFDEQSEASAHAASPSAADGPQVANRRSECAVFRGEDFPPLPQTAREVDELSELWASVGSAGVGEAPESNVLALTAAGASEGAFKARAPGKRVLHLATHGFFLGGECRSALDQDRSDGPEVLPAAGAGENPSLLSGLALAGANQREQAGPDEEDGILTAEEIAALDLSGIEWAVLSACETGVGEVQAGEGVFGLRRAFQVAGARTLIMSLWSVEDEATREWMRRLYEARLEQGLPTAEAVREASLGMLQERRAKGESTHPFFWGAFVAAGDWR